MIEINGPALSPLLPKPPASVDTPWDSTADSCARRSAQVLFGFGLLAAAVVRLGRWAVKK